MNDWHEVRFGIIEGHNLVKTHEKLRFCLRTKERHEIFLRAFAGATAHFEQHDAMDIFVFCLSDHTPSDFSGRLSMWRGYGGNGKGVCIVFDTSKIPHNDAASLVISRVSYGSEETRRATLSSYIDKYCDIIACNDIADEVLFYTAQALFERFRLAAVFLKDSAFEEEREWRVVYWKTRDTASKMSNYFHYFVGQRGVEPKLKLNTEALAATNDSNLKLEDLMDRIILGPSGTSVLQVRSVQRMLELLKLPNLAKKVVSSKIPYRAN